MNDVLAEIHRICEEQAKKAEKRSLPRAPKCDNCEGHGLLYRCSVSDGRTYWAPVRCCCEQAFDYGVVGKTESGRLEYGNRPYGRDIPHEFNSYTSRGAKLARSDQYTISERLHAEDMLNAGGTTEAQAEREAIQGEPDYSFDGAALAEGGDR